MDLFSGCVKEALLAKFVLERSQKQLTSLKLSRIRNNKKITKHHSRSYDKASSRLEILVLFPHCHKRLQIICKLGIT